MKRSLLWIPLVLALVAGAACDKGQVKADGTPMNAEEEIDSSASEETLQSMREMRQAVDELSDLLVKGDAMTDTERGDVLVLLESLDARVGDLVKSGQTTGHKSVDQGLAALHEQIGKARTDAQATPPNYFEANNVAATCLNCHSTLDAQ